MTSGADADFFDTNVLLAAYLWTGLALDIFKTASVDHTLLISEDVIEEAKRVLARRRFDFLADELAEFETWARRHCEVVPGAGRRPTVEVRDPEDALILAAAQTASADMLVTRDQDLLDLAGGVATPIITRPEDFRDALSGTS